jgi:5-methylcytosine-specific restriction endonuclease McrA
MEAQKYRCYYAACGYSKFKKVKGQYVYHLEHTIPLSRVEHSPRHDINYVVLACPECNIRKGAKLPHEFFEGGRLF